MAQLPQAGPGLETLIVDELRGARGPGSQMSVVFEEIIDLSTRAVAGHEVLTRIGGSASPMVTPEIWFAGARRLGVAPAVEARAVELAMDCLPGGSGVVAVNFSPDCLDTPEVGSVLDKLARLERTVVVELSEHHHTSGTMLADSLGAIRRRGLLIAVDDAGTGESGPEFVRAVRPDVIKIDRKHVAALDSDGDQRTTLMTYARLATEGGSSIVAEGVSSSRILHALADLGHKWGVDFLGQGHWLTRARIASSRRPGGPAIAPA